MNIQKIYENYVTKDLNKKIFEKKNLHIKILLLKVNNFREFLQLKFNNIMTHFFEAFFEKY